MFHRRNWLFAHKRLIDKAGRSRIAAEAAAISVPTAWPVMLARLLRKAMPMRFALEIGETEKNRLEFQFNQLLGSTIIKVNNHEVKKTVRYFSEPLLERHVVEVGKEERHTVFIEKHRKLLFGQKYMVYVNERLVKLLHGV